MLPQPSIIDHSGIGYNANSIDYWRYSINFNNADFIVFFLLAAALRNSWLVKTQRKLRSKVERAVKLKSRWKKNEIFSLHFIRIPFKPRSKERKKCYLLFLFALCFSGSSALSRLALILWTFYHIFFSLFSALHLLSSSLALREYRSLKIRSIGFFLLSSRFSFENVFWFAWNI